MDHERFAHVTLYKRASVSNSLFKKDWTLVIQSWFRFNQLLTKKWAIRSKIRFLACFWQLFPFFCPGAHSLFFKRATWAIHSNHSLQKSDCERFSQVAHDKRATGAIHSFSLANHSFAHKKQLNLSKTIERIPNSGSCTLLPKEKNWKYRFY